MENYSTKSTSRNTAELIEPVVIEETSTTRKVLDVVLNVSKTVNGETVGITIHHQRKLKNAWEDIKSIPLSSLKGGEYVKLKLDSATTRKLYESLSKLYKLVEEHGIEFGEREYIVAHVAEILKVSKDRKALIEKLIEDNHGAEVWKELLEVNPNLATSLTAAKIHADRSKVLEEFKENLEQSNSDEGFWQSFFENHTWIFGYGLNYKFLNEIEGQPNYGGANYTGKGNQKGDFMKSSQGAIKFTVLVEIKTPSTPLLVYEKNGNAKLIRNGTMLLSSHLLGATTQIQINIRTWSKNSQNKENAKELESNHIFTVEPKGVLVIGNLNELKDDEDKINSFEVYRRNLFNPEIITYDELYERAYFLVHNRIEEPEAFVEDTDDDLPF